MKDEKQIRIPVCYNYTNTTDIYNNNIQCQRVDIFKQNERKKKMCEANEEDDRKQTNTRASIDSWNECTWCVPISNAQFC